jgi:aldehyde dehydrogenase (NAD+)
MDQRDEIHEAIRRAKDAQVLWEQVPVRQRAKRINGFAALVVKHRTRLAQQVLYPTRANYLETITSELLPLAETAKWLGASAPRVLKSRRTSRLSTPMWLGSLSSRVERVPRGLVLILGTWNYPIFLTGSQLLHALVAGNAVLLKPAPGCEQVTSSLAEMCSQCGIPEGLVQVIGSSVDAGQMAMELGVDHVVMTGSSRSGRKVLEQSIANLCTSTLELSGCDSVLVLPSADLQRVTSLLRFGLRLNGGATCIAPRRVFVLEAMLEQFCSLLKEKLRQEAEPWNTWVTAATCRQLDRLVHSALDQGAALLVPWERDIQQGRDLPFPQACTDWVSTGQIVLSQVDPKMDIYGVDIFAPLLTIVPVRDIEQAIQYNNACRYGLCVSIFGSPTQGAELARRLKSGSVILNDFVVPTADPRLPFGGRRESGFGVTRGEEGLLEMTIPQVISDKRGKWLPHSDLPHPRDEQLLDGLLQLQHGENWIERFRGLKQLIASMKRHKNKKNS